MAWCVTVLELQDVAEASSHCFMIWQTQDEDHSWAKTKPRDFNKDRSPWSESLCWKDILSWGSVSSKDWSLLFSALFCSDTIKKCCDLSVGRMTGNEKSTSRNQTDWSSLSDYTLWYLQLNALTGAEPGGEERLITVTWFLKCSPKLTAERTPQHSKQSVTFHLTGSVFSSWFPQTSFRTS